MREPSLKTKAQDIVTAVDRDLEEIEAKSPAVQEDVVSQANNIVDRLFNVVSDVDLEAATARAEALRQRYPNATLQELAQKLVREKCQRTGTVGAVTSGMALIPGVGSAAALTLGAAADIGTTFKLQAELVLEIAALYDYPLTEEEKQRLVMVITGISAGTTALTYRVGQNLAIKAGEKYAGKAFLKAIPIMGIFASAGTNVLSTYIIGQRADTYFRLGPEAVPTWADSLRAVSGVDERRIAGWLAESGKSTGTALVAGAGKAGQVGKTAGGVVATGVGTGAKKAGATAQKGVKAYFRWLKTFWSAVFRGAARIIGIIWAALTYIPRKVMGLFKK